MFGEFLISNGKLTQEGLEEALSVQPISKEKIGRILVELGYLTQLECDISLASYLNIQPEKNIISIISGKNAREKIQIIREGDSLGFFINEEPKKFFIKSFSDLLVKKAEKVHQNFDILTLNDEQWDLMLSLSPEPISQEGPSVIKSEVEPVRIVTSTPYKDMLISLLQKAKKVNASDVHFDSTLDGVAVRYRVNGDLTTVKVIKRDFAQSFISVVKSHTGLPLTVIGSPCSGAARFPELNLKVRAQSNGQIYGETIVLRLINEERIKNVSIDSIGADEIFKSDIKKALGYSNGLILMCGQTGSGKSWTLYSLLMSMDRQSSKIITIEDPVEYEGPGLMQIEVTEGKVGFQDALRSSLRLDPDVIMVGEIRDEETAELAFKAASTGHLVLSTLHTNGAMEAITRLKGLGIADDMIEANVRLISALTLKKQLCEHCKIPISPEESELLSEEANSLLFSGSQLYRRNIEGCTHLDCYQGATGRVLIYESISQEDVINQREGLVTPGFRSLKQCALEKAALGKIGIEEVTYV